MRRVGRVFTPVIVAALAVAGPVAFGASSAGAAQPSAVIAGSGSTLSGPITCNPDQFRIKAQAHLQKAADYQVLRNKELAKANPSPKKVNHYDKKSRAHTQRAEEYRAKAEQCEDADNNL